jgi:hypothetical protein
MVDIRARDLGKRGIARGSRIEVNHWPGSGCALRCNRRKAKPREKSKQQQNIPHKRDAGVFSIHKKLDPF